MDAYDIPKPMPRAPLPPPPQSPPYLYPGYPTDGYPPSAYDRPAYGQPDYRSPDQQPRLTAPGRAGHRRGAPSRRSGILATLLTTLGCLAGSLAVTAFIIATIVLNPDRPGAIVKAALSTSAGRSVATAALASALRTSDPALSPAQASADAATIVNTPALASSLGSSKPDVSGALLDQLKAVDPAAAARVSAHTSAGAANASPLSALPSGVLSAASRAHSALRSAWQFLLIVAVLAIGAALLIGPRRDRILVRVGIWAVGASVVQLVIWFALPKALGHFSRAWAQVAAAALRAGGSGLLVVFAVLAIGGVACLTIGLAGRFVTRLASS